MSRIPIAENNPNFNYWKSHSERGEPMETMPIPCHDCAITTGFYEPYAEELSKESLDIQKKCAERWWCHNNGQKSCKGVSNYLNLTPCIGTTESHSPKGTEAEGD